MTAIAAKMRAHCLVMTLLDTPGSCTRRESRRYRREMGARRVCQSVLTARTNPRWNWLICVATMISVLSLTCLAGWYTDSAAEDAEQLLREQAIAMVMSELGGRVHASWLSSGIAALTSCMVMMIRAHTWHM